MLYENILVPYDNSDAAHAALTEAVRIAAVDEETKIRIVQIVDIAERMEARLGERRYEEIVDDSREEYTEEQDAVITEADEELHASISDVLEGVPNTVYIEFLDRTSSPASQIAEYAETHGNDLIVMGSRGLGAVRGMLGSVSNGVLRSTDIPVLVVR